MLGNTRFTVLTPDLVRMEWCADGKYDDHSSLVFINRRLPVPKYSHELTGNGSKLTIKTSGLPSTYQIKGDGRFTRTI